jgi:tripartite-type tricarboxylate transporter receptor subunit TctC
MNVKPTQGIRFRCFLQSSVLAVLALYVVFPSTALSQQDAALAAHFSGKPVTIIVGSSPGGGYDISARMVARFVGKYLPGNPTFIIKNIPGGGQLRGLRATMKAKPDGLTIGQLHPRFVVQELFGKDVPDFDLNTVKVLGTPTGVDYPRMWCTRRELAASWQDVVKRGKPVSVGANAPGGLSATLGPEFVQALGGPVKIIFGYGGASEVMAGFDRRELDSIQYCTDDYVPRLFPEWIKQKRLAPMFWWAAKPSDDYVGQLGSSNLPHIADALGATADQRKALDVAIGFGRMGRLLVAPPGLDEPIYEAWKAALKATVGDPEFKKAAAAAELDVGFGSAEDFRENNAALKKLPKNLQELVRKLAGMS